MGTRSKTLAKGDMPRRKGPAGRRPVYRLDPHTDKRLAIQAVTDHEGATLREIADAAFDGCLPAADAALRVLCREKILAREGEGYRLNFVMYKNPEESDDAPTAEESENSPCSSSTT